MTILITGANGHLSKPLIEKFFKYYGDEVFCLTRNSSIQDKRNVLFHDLSKSSFKIPNFVKIIIHCASITPRSRKKLFDNNSIISNNLLKSINEHGKIKKLINFSTVSIFDQIQKNKIVNQDSNKFSKDLYAVSKIKSEIILGQSKSSAIYNLRIPGVLVDENSKNFITRLIKEIIANKKIIIFNKSNKYNNVISIHELFLFINNIILNNYNGGNILLGCNKPITIEELVLFLFDKFNKKSKIIWKTNNKGFHINLNKTISDYEYSPKDTIQIIETYIDRYFKKYV